MEAQEMEKGQKRLYSTLRRSAWILVVLLCVLLMLIIMFPVRCISVSESGYPSFLSLGSTNLSQKDPRKQYLQSVLEESLKNTQRYVEEYAVDRARSSGTGIYVIKLGSGKRLVVVCGRKVVLNLKI